MFGISSARALALDIPAAPRDGYIVDQADILSPEDELGLNTQIAVIRQNTSNELGILTLKDGEGIDPAQFGVEVGREWGIGTKENKNGILILVTLENPKYIQISVSTGLEGALPDVLAARIARDEIAPEFKNGNYFAGLSAGVAAADSATRGEYSAGDAVDGRDAWNGMYLVFFGGYFLVGLTSLMAKSKSWWAGGIVGTMLGGGAGILGSNLIMGLLLGTSLGGMGLGLDWWLSKNYDKHKKLKKADTNHHTPWYFGGSGSGGGFSGGGGGGFSGGGSFGGGGGGSSW